MTILGRDRHLHAACFDELDEALRALGVADTVFLNAHEFSVPEDGVVYNLENVGLQVSPHAFEGHVVWDFSARNVTAFRHHRQTVAGKVVLHVPVGYHPTMERFAKVPSSECAYDVAFCGAMNVRRYTILSALQRAGLRVLVVPHHLYGLERDRLLAQSRLALGILFYPDGLHTVLRTAHCTANRLPILSEYAPEAPAWALLQVGYDGYVDRAVELVRRRREVLDAIADAQYVVFRMHPMTLPAIEPGAAKSVSRALERSGDVPEGVLS